MKVIRRSYGGCLAHEAGEEKGGVILFGSVFKQSRPSRDPTQIYDVADDSSIIVTVETVGR